MNMLDPLDLTGQWNGTFAYPGSAGPATPFVAAIDEIAGYFTGSINEPDLFTGAVIVAAITGTRSGSSVDFTKTYGASASGAYDNPVDYVGSLSPGGTIVTGVWSLLDWDGTFEMVRDEAASEPVVEAATEQVPVE